MNPNTLLDELKIELGTLFSGYLLKNSEGKDVTPTDYLYDLPRRSAKSTITSLAPYRLIFPTDGNIQDPTAPYDVKIAIGIVVWNGYDDQNGDRDVMHQINVIMDRFLKNPALKTSSVKFPINWSVNSEIETGQFAVGAIEITFELPKEEREDLLT